MRGGVRALGVGQTSRKTLLNVPGMGWFPVLGSFTATLYA
jgi:hypothetical protein